MLLLSDFNSFILFVDCWQSLHCPLQECDFYCNMTAYIRYWSLVHGVWFLRHYLIELFLLVEREECARARMRQVFPRCRYAACSVLLVRQNHLLWISRAFRILVVAVVFVSSKFIVCARAEVLTLTGRVSDSLVFYYDTHVPSVAIGARYFISAAVFIGMCCFGIMMMVSFKVVLSFSSIPCWSCPLYLSHMEE